LKTHQQKLSTILRNPRHYGLMVVAFFLVGMSFGPWYYLTTFINTYGVVLLQRDAALAYFLNAGICVAISLIIYGIMGLQKHYPPTTRRIYIYYVLFILLLFPASSTVFQGQAPCSYV
ncbi:MAG: hypothetical protein Q8K36_03915, partial [Alphaproteobacteria bacterium]|nr:hypothetical protein [Alphaproteobacteria bacterium]